MRKEFSDKTIAKRNQRLQDAKATILINIINPHEKKRRSGNYKGHERYILKDSGMVIAGNYFFDQDSHKAGDAIEFVMKYHNMSFNEALEFLAPESNYASFELDNYKPAPKQEHKRVEEQITPEEIEKKFSEFVFPEEDMSNYKNNIFYYLVNLRKLDNDVVQYLVNKRIIRQDNKKNCVFVWYDHKGRAVGGNVRGTTGAIMEQTGREFMTSIFNEGTKDTLSSFFGFNIIKGTPKKMYVFEAPLDLIAYLCLNKGNPKLNDALFITTGGLSMNVIKTFMMLYPEASNEIILCVDNDEAADQFEQAYFVGKYEYTREIPVTKDWNDDLKFGLRNNGNQYKAGFERSTLDKREFRQYYVDVINADGEFERVNTYFMEYVMDEKGKMKWKKVNAEAEIKKMIQLEDEEAMKILDLF